MAAPHIQMGPCWSAVTGVGLPEGGGPSSPIFGARNLWALGHEVHPTLVRLRAAPREARRRIMGRFSGSSPPRPGCGTVT